MEQEKNERAILQISLEDLIAELKGRTKTEEFLLAQQLDKRELYLPEIIDDSVIFETVQHIFRYNQEDEGKPIKDRKPITIFINCYGGDVIACFTVIQAIRNSKTPITTFNIGKAFSAGGLILMSGHNRLSYRDSVVLVHQGSSGASGTTGQVIDQVEFQKRQEERIKSYILGATNITPEQYKEKYKEEWYFFGDESLKLGVVDEIVG